MSKYFFLERLGTRQVKGIVVNDYGNIFKPVSYDVIVQGGARIKRNCDSTETIVQGSISDVFPELPKTLLCHDQTFTVIMDNEKLIVTPISVCAGPRTIVLGAQVRYPKGGTKIVGETQLQEYEWLRDNKPSATQK